MQPRDKISKSSWMLLESIKDSITTKLVEAVRSGQIKVEAKELPTLLAVLKTSADSGYHTAHPTFMKAVEAALPDASKTKPTAKKK